jgi:mannose-6-phosphate isomerase-like protein (cupin superfamily)
MKILSKENSLMHYKWGENCDGWNFVDENSLSIKLEKMLPQTSEQKHYHEHVQQFFFITKGIANFEIDDENFIVKQNEGIHILPKQKHKISNTANEDLEFILSSQPSTVNDRINCD